MNKIELLGKEISKVSTELSNTKIKNIDEQDFLNTFLQVFKVDNPKSYEQITRSSYLISLLIASGINIEFDKLISYLKDIEIFVDSIEVDEELYRKYLVVLQKLYDMNILDKIENREEIKKFNSKEKYYYDSYKKLSKKIFTLEDDDENTRYYFEVDKAFINMFNQLPDISLFESFLELDIVLEKAKSLFNTKLEEVMYSELNFKIKQKDKDKLFNKIFKEMLKRFPDLKINQHYKIIFDYHSKIRKQVKEDVSSVNKRLRKIEDFIFKLNYLNPDKIINLENYEEYLFDPRIRYRFVDFCMAHNLELCKDLEEKNKEYQSNKITKLEVIFTKYGFNFNDLKEEEKNSIIDDVKVEDIESILAVLKYSELKFLTEYHKEFTNLIINSNIDRIKTIDCAIKNKIIDKQTLIRHLEILFCESDYNNFKNNINLLTLKNIDLFNLLKTNPEVLFLNNNKLNEVFKILNEYRFELDNTNNYQILIKNQLLDIIDNFIELGLYHTLKNNQKVLTEDGYDVVKRILICNLLDIDPVNSQNRLIGQVTSGNKFYVANNNLDNYIINSEGIYLNPLCVSTLNDNKRNVISEETKDNYLIKQMDEVFKVDSLSYKINGVIISRNRVLKNFEVLKEMEDLEPIDMLYQSVLYKTVGNIEEEKLIEIYNSLKKLNVEKTKLYKK